MPTNGISLDGKLLVISQYNQPAGEEAPRDYRTSTLYTSVEGDTPVQK